MIDMKVGSFESAFIVAAVFSLCASPSDNASVEAICKLQAVQVLLHYWSPGVSSDTLLVLNF
jgi:hypothetical protein